MFHFLALDKLLVLKITGLIWLAVSRDLEDTELDASTVIDVRHSKCALGSLDLSQHEFDLQQNERKEVEVIEVFGDIHFRIISLGCQVELAELGPTYPAATED